LIQEKIVKMPFQIETLEKKRLFLIERKMTRLTKSSTHSKHLRISLYSSLICVYMCVFVVVTAPSFYRRQRIAKSVAWVTIFFTDC
jgi:hypothetical protein